MIRGQRRRGHRSNVRIQEAAPASPRIAGLRPYGAKPVFDKASENGSLYGCVDGACGDSESGFGASSG
jgi:hypothetical protein